MTINSVIIEIESAKTTDDILLIGERCSRVFDFDSLEGLKDVARKRIRQIMGAI